MSIANAYSACIVAARRSALGRIGGLHRARRIEDLAAPVLAAALADARLPPGRIDEVIIGTATAGGNPARLIALAAGLPMSTPACTIDRQCGSGLDAVLAAVRLVAAGEADAVVAGGAESLSTAPWRIARPRSIHQTPRFLAIDAGDGDGREEPPSIAAAEALARRLGIGRARQDDFALMSHLRGEAARTDRRFAGEIVPLRPNAEEGRDQMAEVPPTREGLAEMPPYLDPDGTLTRGNTSPLHDGAAMVVVVSESLHRELGAPPALRLTASAAHGVPPADAGAAPIEAVRKLYHRLNGFDRSAIGLVELGETSAVQAIALAEELGIDTDLISPDGGALARGHSVGAAGAVLVARLFTRLARRRDARSPRYGLATVGASGGLGVAALFEAR